MYLHHNNREVYEQNSEVKEVLQNAGSQWLRHIAVKQSGQQHAQTQ